MTDLSLEALFKALKSEIVIAWPVAPPGVHLLDHAGGDPGCRHAILSALQGLRRRLRRSVFVEVTGKGRGEGRKMRRVPFPIELVEDLLEVGTWGVRREQLRAWKAADSRYVSPPQLFLSFKTKCGLHPGSVGDLLKAAFKAVSVDGSGHRLRAYCATRMAIRLFHERVAENGFKLDASVRDWVLERVAEALGHESSRTTVKHYVDLAELEYLGAENRSRLGGIAALWDKFLDHATALTPERQALVAAVLQALAQENSGPSLEIIIRMALDDSGTPTPSLLREAGRTGAARLSLVGGTES